MLTEAEQMVSFTALDRCDQCQAQALAQADKAGFEPLLFCGHHTDKHEDALLSGGWLIRWALSE